MGLSEFLEKKQIEQAIIDAQDVLYEARDKLSTAFTEQGARYILEGYGYDFPDEKAREFRSMINDALIAGIDPNDLQTAINNASEVLNSSPPAAELREAEYFIQTVRTMLEY